MGLMKATNEHRIGWETAVLILTAVFVFLFWLLMVS